MKIPKNVREKQFLDNRRTPLTVNKVFTVFCKSYQRFSILDIEQKDRYISKLISRVPFDKPRFKPKDFELYNIVRRKSTNFLKDIGFVCKQCGTCCSFRNEDLKFKSAVGIFHEDFIKLKQNHIDISGITRNSSKNEMQFFNEIKDIYGVGHISDELYQDINLKGYEILGFYGKTRLIKKGNKNLCFYFDEATNSCRIHPVKPLLCFTHPLFVRNDFKGVGIQRDLDCNWIIAQRKRRANENFEESFYSYYEYLIAILLFLREKKRIRMKDGLYVLNDDEKEKIVRKYDLNKRV